MEPPLEDSSTELSSHSAPLSVDQVREFERAYSELMNDVFRYTFSCVGRREIAEEITSDVFLSLYRNFAGIEAEWRRPWLFRVAKNLATSYWRRRVVEQRHEQAVVSTATQSSGPEESSLEQVILQSPDLKPSHRSCLILRYFHGMERDEIVKATGLSANQVKSCLQYGLELLRRQFQKPGGET